MAGSAVVGHVDGLLRDGESPFNLARGDRDLREPIERPRDGLGVPRQPRRLNVAFERVEGVSQVRR